MPVTPFVLRCANQRFGFAATGASRIFLKKVFEASTNFTESQNWQVELPAKKSGTCAPRRKALAWQVKATNCASGPFIGSAPIWIVHNVIASLAPMDPNLVPTEERAFDAPLPFV